MRIDFGPFINDKERQFIVDGVDHYNIATTNLPNYFPVNFILRGECGDVLSGVLGELWGGWLHVTCLWVAETARGGGGIWNAAYDGRRGIRSHPRCHRRNARDIWLPGPAIP